jgi:probable phosphoglycerate mutase
MTQALLLRHGESVSNAHPEALTLPEEIGDRLTENGLDQARAAAEALEGLNVTSVLSSPMHRAGETAEVVSERLGLPLTTLPFAHELREETGFGHLSADEQNLRRCVTRMFTHPEDPDHSHNGAESFNEVIERVRLLKAELESQPEGAKPLVVTHGIFARFFLFESLLGDRFLPATTARLWNLRSRNCGLSVFERIEHWHPTNAGTPNWTCVTWMARPWDPP